MYQPTTDPKELLLILTRCALGARLGSEFFNLVILGEVNKSIAACERNILRNIHLTTPTVAPMTL